METNKMTLGDKRRLFSILLAEFILWAAKEGYEVAICEVLRDKRIAELNEKEGKGISNSLHLIGLAVDLALYIDSEEGKDDNIYQKDSEAYRLLGEKWESMHPLCCWGGRFKKPDGNHFSLEHEGVR